MIHEIAEKKYRRKLCKIEHVKKFRALIDGIIVKTENSSAPKALLGFKGEEITNLQTNEVSSVRELIRLLFFSLSQLFAHLNFATIFTAPSN